MQETAEFVLINHLDERSKQNIVFWYAFKISIHGAFSAFITLCIIANTIALAQDRHLIDNKVDHSLDIVNLTFYSIFALEMLIKLTG